MPAEIKRRVIPNNITMGKPTTINISINKRESYNSNLVQLFKISAMRIK